MQKNPRFEPRSKIRTNSYVELKGYVEGNVPYETHRIGLRPPAIVVGQNMWAKDIGL